MKPYMNNALFFCFMVSWLLTSCGAPLPDSRSSTPDEPATSASSESSKRVVNPPTEELTIDYVEFNSSSIANTPPDDILEEISYYGGGGWGTPSCSDQNLQIYRNEDIRTEPGCIISIYSCGWQEHENVSVTVVYADGRQETSKTQASTNADSSYPIVDIRRLLAVTDPSGSYKIIFEGTSGKLEQQISVIKPKSPSVYLYSNGLFLKNFVPMEKIRFFVYEMDKQGSATLVGWVGFEIDEHGEKDVRIREQDITSRFLEKYLYIIVGEISGQFLPKEPETCKESSWGIQLDSVVRKKSTNTCGNLVSRLSQGNTGRVAFTDGTQMRIRAKPGLTQNVLYKVPEGSVFTVLEGPQCKDQIPWWRVSTKDGSEGWVAEYQNGTYLLEPFP